MSDSFTPVASRSFAILPVMRASTSGTSNELRRGLSSTHLPALDGLRAVAVFLVILYHSGLEFPGGLGVLLFFVISGFLITWLLLKEADRFGTVSLKDFYIRRMLRIFPAFYVFAGLLIGHKLLFHKPIHWHQALASLFFVNNYYQALTGDPNTAFSHTWSLAIEEQFYFLWPSVFLLLVANRKRMAKYLAAAILGIWTYRVVLVLGFHVDQGYLYEAFDARADSLMMGCLLATLLHARMLEGMFNWVCSHWMKPVVTVLLLVCSVKVAQYTGSAVYRDTVGFAVDSLLAAILICQMIAFRASPLWSWLNWRWVRLLGVLSYSLYLYQQVVLPLAHKSLESLPGLWRNLFAIAAVVAVALCSYYAVEQPALKLKARFSRLPLQKC